MRPLESGQHVLAQTLKTELFLQAASSEYVPKTSLFKPGATFSNPGVYAA